MKAGFQVLKEKQLKGYDITKTRRKGKKQGIYKKVTLKRKK